MARALEGVRILDLTHMLSGPYASMILADLGAETIKVEPLAGEGTRRLLATDPKNSLDGMGAYFLTLNRNKKSIAIDLKNERGRELFYKLVGVSDIVISNFTPGVPERLGVDYASVAAVNPRIIACTVTGFGSNGPGRRRPAFDQVAQATGGGMSITGRDRRNPMRAGIPIGDLGGGMFGVMGVLAALYERERSGRGQEVDISMLDGQISMLNYMATMYFLSGENPHPIGNAHFVHVPYDTFECADGFIVIAVITDNFWQNLKQVLACDDLDKPEYDSSPAVGEIASISVAASTRCCPRTAARTGSGVSRNSAFPARRSTRSSRRCPIRRCCTGTWSWNSSILRASGRAVRAIRSSSRERRARPLPRRRRSGSIPTRCFEAVSAWTLRNPGNCEPTESSADGREGGHQ